MDNTIPQVLFQFLAIALALAAFLPALVYSYAKGLMDELEQSFEAYRKDVVLMGGNNNETDNGHKFHTIRKNIPRFIYAIDLILTQSMLLVAFSGCIGVTIYLCCINVSTQSWYAASIMIFVLTILYLAGLIGSGFKILSLKEQLDKYWYGEKKGNKKKRLYGWKLYVTLWGGSTLILCTSIFLLDIIFYSLLQDSTSLCAQQLKELFFREGHIPLHWIVSLLTLALIIASISWLLPLIHYTPLMGRLDLVLKEITNHASELKSEAK